MDALTRLAAAIGYPDPVSGERAVLKVDGGDVRVRLDGQRIVFERSICTPEEGSGALERLAGYSAGRLLKEEATLAWDPRAKELMLWQEVAANAPDGVLRRVFEVFCTSCDWWLARVNEGGGSAGPFPEMMIMP